MVKVTFRGGRFDGRSRDYAGRPGPAIGVRIADGALRYELKPGQAEGATELDYAFAGESRNVEADVLPIVAHFSGGPFDKRGRRFAPGLASVLVIPLGGGKFCRYRDSGRLEGEARVFDFVEVFEGERV